MAGVLSYMAEGGSPKRGSSRRNFLNGLGALAATTAAGSVGAARAVKKALPKHVEVEAAVVKPHNWSKSVSSYLRDFYDNGDYYRGDLEVALDETDEFNNFVQHLSKSLGRQLDPEIDKAEINRALDLATSADSHLGMADYLLEDGRPKEAWRTLADDHNKLPEHSDALINNPDVAAIIDEMGQRGAIEDALELAFKYGDTWEGSGDYADGGRVRRDAERQLNSRAAQYVKKGALSQWASLNDADELDFPFLEGRMPGLVWDLASLPALFYDPDEDSFVGRAARKTDALNEKISELLGIDPETQSTEDALSESAGAMLAQLPVPGTGLGTLVRGGVRTLPRLARYPANIAQGLSEFMMPVVRPTVGNYATGTAIGTGLHEALADEDYDSVLRNLYRELGLSQAQADDSYDGLVPGLSLGGRVVDGVHFLEDGSDDDDDDSSNDSQDSNDANDSKDADEGPSGGMSADNETGPSDMDGYSGGYGPDGHDGFGGQDGMGGPGSSGENDNSTSGNEGFGSDGLGGLSGLSGPTNDEMNTNDLGPSLDGLTNDVSITGNQGLSGLAGIANDRGLLGQVERAKSRATRDLDLDNMSLDEIDSNIGRTEIDFDALGLPTKSFWDKLWNRVNPINKVKRAIENPFATAIDFLAGKTPLAAYNLIAGNVFGAPTIGEAVTSFARGVTGYDENPQQAITNSRGVVGINDHETIESFNNSAFGSGLAADLGGRGALSQMADNAGSEVVARAPGQPWNMPSYTGRMFVDPNLNWNRFGVEPVDPALANGVFFKGMARGGRLRLQPDSSLHSIPELPMSSQIVPDAVDEPSGFFSTLARYLGMNADQELTPQSWINKLIGGAANPDDPSTWRMPMFNDPASGVQLGIKPDELRYTELLDGLRGYAPYARISGKDLGEDVRETYPNLEFSTRYQDTKTNARLSRDELWDALHESEDLFDLAHVSARHDPHLSEFLGDLDARDEFIGELAQEHHAYLLGALNPELGAQDLWEAARLPFVELAVPAELWTDKLRRVIDTYLPESKPETQYQGTQRIPGPSEDYRESLTLHRPGDEGYTPNSHFNGQPNLLSWSRTDRRKLDDGSTVRLLNEIQSDWHQKGQRHGYRDTTPREIENLTRQLENLGYRVDTGYRGPGEADVYPELFNANGERLDVHPRIAGGPVPEAHRQLWTRLYDRLTGVEDNYNKPPPAPFSKNYGELELKKNVIQALQDGDKYVAITNVPLKVEGGEHGTKLRGLEWKKHENAFGAPEDGYSITMIDLNGVRTEKLATVSDIKNSFGPDIAKKIADGGDEGTIAEDVISAKPGMRINYDQKYQDYARRLAKQYGGKLTEIEVPVGASKKSRQVEKLESAIKQGNMQNTDFLTDDVQHYLENLGVSDEAMDRLNSLAARGFLRDAGKYYQLLTSEHKGRKVKVPALKLTDEFKEKFKKAGGLPLFTAAPFGAMTLPQLPSLAGEDDE